MHDTDSILLKLKQLTARGTVADKLIAIAAAFKPGVCFSTSFGWEDQVITHLIAENKVEADFFTLDTGRLFAETYSTWNATLERYGIKIKSWHPDTEAIAEFVTANGPNSFYESVEFRKRCCYLRKVEPLQKALKGYKIWITGIRAEQSPERSDMTDLEYDEQNNIYKFHPLLHWSLDDVKTFVQQNHVPINPLHHKGFVSIGCQPCTRAIRPGEDFRAGRWWWEDATKKECGLHVHEEIKQ